MPGRGAVNCRSGSGSRRLSASRSASLRSGAAISAAFIGPDAGRRLIPFVGDSFAGRDGLLDVLVAADQRDSAAMVHSQWEREP